MKILDTLRRTLTIDRSGDFYPTVTFAHTMGVVMDTDDPLQMGRLRIYCPLLNDDPKKPQHLPWAVYMSPYGGSIRNKTHAKGHDPDKESTSKGTTQYGMWAIPELGSNVVVSCIDGDPRKRVWVGCLYEHQQVGMLFNGVYDWEASDGIPDGPFCAPVPGHESEREPIEPLYTNQATAFTKDGNEADKKSAEWKTRAADYTGMKNVGLSSFGTNSSIQGAEKDSWVKGKLGAMGYDWTAFKNIGAHLASRVVGFMSPGLHSVSFDDRAFNSRIRIRTTAGNQIILDDTNERIYVSTYEGKSWVELDRSGNIDMHADRRISIHGTKDINLTSDETVRIQGKKGIHMYSGDKTGQTPLDSTPANGQIRFHATDDMHVTVEGSAFNKITGNVDTLIGGYMSANVGGAYNMEIGVDTYKIKTPSNKLVMSGGTVQIDASSKFRVEASSIQLGGGSAELEVSGSKITLDAALVQSNDFGTTILEMCIAINALAICADCPVAELIPKKLPVIPDTMLPVNFNVTEAEFAVWPNRIPEHEPWPRVLKQDKGDSINVKNKGYLDNVDSIDQYDNVTSPDGRQPIGVVEGDETITRGEFWRR